MEVVVTDPAEPLPKALKIYRQRHDNPIYRRLWKPLAGNRATMGAASDRLLRASPLILAVCYAVGVLGFARGAAADFAELFKVYAWTMYPLWFLVGMLLLLLGRLRNDFRGVPHSSFRHAGQFLADRWAADRWLSIVSPPLTVTILLCTFNIYKQIQLPSAGFRAEPYLANADRFLLGTDAWRITHWLFASPWATEALDLAYHAWFLPMTLGVVLCSFARPGSRLALRYLTSYVLLWIMLGTLVAYLVPASGPCFYDYFQSDHGRFGDLTNLLAAQDLFIRQHGLHGLLAVEYQRLLLHDFRSSNLALGAGISAMPSLHNAMAVLFACAAYHADRRMGRLFTVYAVLIWIGSIHLGWHYAIDGVVAAVLTIAIWKATGVLHRIRPRVPLTELRAITKRPIAAARLA
jgi:hypothetical protein